MDTRFNDHTLNCGFLLNAKLMTPPSSIKSQAWPDLSLLGVALIWGVNLPLMKSGLDGMEHFSFNAVRLALSALVLVCIALQMPGGLQVPKASWRKILIYGLIASGIYQIIFLLGVARTTAGNASLIMSSVPMWTALLSRFFLKDKLSKLAWSGLIVAFIGTLIVSTAKGISSDEQYQLGNAIMLIGALTWASGTVYSRRILDDISPLKLAAIGSVCMLPLHFIVAGPKLLESLPQLQAPPVWIAILYAGILSTGIALPMWNYGVREAGTSHAAVFQNLVPVIAFSSAWVLRGETITPRQILGGVLIIGGLVIMRQGRTDNMPRPKQSGTP